MQTNLPNQTTKDNLLEEKRKQSYQSWHDPALNTLNGLLKKRKENLKRQNRDVNNAAVTRDEFMQALVDQHGKHGLYLMHAGQIISSLYRAKRIRYLGNTFIQIMDEGEAK
ncbi:hypothetical protein [Acinetobacter calcoaceticus]|uniref:hypothetical protein n=1 Tax=Acinetobacter calcoaceticus TaxID=471 RepID=UPI0018DB403E|nr:hypothetical protein [Acinetobacter calcoaceticus]